jgi:hypothetical protein
MSLPVDPLPPPPQPGLLLPPNRRRFAPLLLIAGAAVAAFMLVPSVPHEHHVTLRLQAPETVTGIDLAWAPEGEALAPHDATQGGAWRFAPGTAPATVDTRVTLPDGRYELDVDVERGVAHEALRRVIRFGDGDNITVPLR